jgi:sialate O-acetylesterase
MAVTLDIGDPVDIHPKDKQDVGLRLSLAARAIAYGEKIEWSGPLYRQLTHEEHALRVWFDHANGLAAKGAPLTGFEIAGEDGKYVAAEARIEGTSVVISNAEVPTPISVRYGWAANPNCNLINREGLPASPFRAPDE